MRLLIIVLAVSLWANVAFGWEKIKSESVALFNLDNKSLPTDIVFKSNKDWLLYDAEGLVTRYINNRPQKPFHASFLVGGNCFVGIGDYFYYCDSQAGMLTVLDSGFKVSYQIGNGTGKRLFDPTDVISTEKENIIIVDNDNHRLLTFNLKDKSFTKVFGYFGFDLGMFRYPFSLVADKDKILFVTDVLNTRVQMISSEPRALLSIGDWGVKPGQMYRPKGIAMINEKYIVVSDGWLGVLQVYDLDGIFIGVITDNKGEILKYKSPTRIRAHGNRLAVLDPYEHIVEIIAVEGLQ